jgi:hypothetical protein
MTSPKYLFITLKRFQVNSAAKIGDHVAISHKLNMDQYCDSRCQYKYYKLCGVIVHEGWAITGGHYISYVKREGKWYCVNDSLVKPVEKACIKDLEAYCLLYRANELQVQPVQKKNKIEKSLKILSGDVADSQKAASTDPSTEKPTSASSRSMHSSSVPIAGLAKSREDCC